MSHDQRPLCRCVDNECLHGHCMWFSTGWFCSKKCGCPDCGNTEDNEDEVEERAFIFLKEKKKSDAFSPKMTGAQDTVQMHAASSDPKLLHEFHGHEPRSHFKGCKCEECVNRCGIRGSDSNIEPDQVDTRSIAAESIHVEHPTQSRDTGGSDPNKRPRIW